MATQSGMREKPNPAKNSEPPPPPLAMSNVSPASAMPTGAMIHAHARPKPLRKRNHTPSGTTTSDGMPMATHFQLVLRRPWRRSSSSVPRMAETMLTPLTFMDEMTTVRNVITTPRQ